MINCEDFLSDAESDSHFGSEVKEYVDSDKADSDIECELYSQIYYTENLEATASAQSLKNDSVYDVNPVKSIGSFPLLQSKIELVTQGTLETMRFDHFESSTPKVTIRNNLIIGKQICEANLINPVISPKRKNGTGRIASGSVLKPCKSSEDSGCFESATGSDNLDGGDSEDSVVILETPVANVENEVIVLDSTPTSDDTSVSHKSASSSSSDSEDSLKLSSSATSSMANQSGDLWHIDHEDRFSFIKKQRRYHEKHSSICNNCKKRGHLSKDCLEPRNTKCYICGRDHVWSMCHHRMCGRCLEYGHSTKKCRYKSSEVSCSLCKMRGHSMHGCPDIWRRYHLTTSPDSIVKGPKEIVQGVKKFCYNCGREGHYGHECLRPRMSPDSFPTWPFVISYKDPFRYLKKHPKKSSNTGESSNSSRHYDSYSKHKYNKKHRSHSEEPRITMSEKHSQNSTKSRNRQKDKKKQSKDERYISASGGSDFPRSLSSAKLDEDSHKNKKKRKKKGDMDRLFAFKRKKQKLNITV